MSKVENYSDLPKGIQDRIQRLNPKNPEEWTQQKIPALNDKSVIELMNEDDGYAKICEFLGKLEGHWL